jgi:hypothetical protein
MVYGKLHVCIVERENPEKTTEDGEEMTGIRLKEHLLCAYIVQDHV